jgi:hypothetical protein
LKLFIFKKSMISKELVMPPSGMVIWKKLKGLI